MTGRKKGFIVACVSVCVFIAAGGAAVAITEWSVRQKAQSQVLYQLSTIDDQIAKGHYAQAERLLDDLKDFSYDFSLYKEIMKRVFRIAEVQNRYERFLSFAQSAAETYPNEEEAESLYIYALLKNHQADKAWEAVSLSFQNRRVLPSLFAEAALRSGNGSQVKAVSLDAFSRAALSIALSDDPNGYLYLKDRIDDPRLVKNYIISLALSGNLSGALDLFNEEIGIQNPMLGSYLAYDAGDFEKAYSYAQMLDKNFFMETNRDWYLFLADLCMETGVVNEASSLYADFVNNYPDYSFVPYFNLAWIYKGTPDAVKYMEQGVAAFPDIAVLNLKLAQDYMALGQNEKARAVLKNFLQTDADNVDAVLAYRFSDTAASPELFIGVLWNLYNKNKKVNEKIPQIFLWYLVGLSDSAEMDRLLSHCRRDYGERAWIDFYAGVSAVLKEDFNAAYDAFLACTQKAERSSDSFPMGYQPFYNCALLSLYFGHPDQALKEADALRSYIDWEDDALSAAVHVLYGRIYLMKDEREKAMRSFRLAHDLDPANIEVVSYLDYLNSGIEK